MAMIVAIQMALVTLVMAQVPLNANNYTDFWWFHTTSNRSTLSAPPIIPCLLRSQSAVIKRDDYTYTSGIGGYKIHTRAVIWNEARITCEEEGGHLAIINSIAEANAITEIFTNAETITGSPYPQFASIGFHDYYSEGHHVTIYGQTLAKAGFTLWAPGEPDNAKTGENCGSLNESGRLNDVPCDIKLGFICEIPV